MADDQTQTYRTHAKTVPLYHYVVLPVLAANVVFAMADLGDAVTTRTVFGVIVAIALILLAVYARVFALRVQDRVIRLEMRLRMREVLPAEMHARIREFTVEQLIGMRFASDEELPELADAVLRDKVTDRKAIKQMIRQWEADHTRA